MYDVTIIGGGPAGLSAALLLSRARRRVLLCDTGKPRNAVSRAMHGFLSRDGFNPAELRKIGRSDLEKYDAVEIRDEGVIHASGSVDRFIVTLASREKIDARRLLLSFGVEDQLPAIEGLRELWGSVWLMRWKGMTSTFGGWIWAVQVKSQVTRFNFFPPRSKNAVRHIHQTVRRLRSCRTGQGLAKFGCVTVMGRNR